MRGIRLTLDAAIGHTIPQEELVAGLASKPECAKFLGVANPKDEREIREMFERMNTNDDDIVDFQEFSAWVEGKPCLLYTSPSPRDQRGSRMPSSA